VLPLPSALPPLSSAPPLLPLLPQEDVQRSVNVHNREAVTRMARSHGSGTVLNFLHDLDV
jgi:hypothetical protein